MLNPLECKNTFCTSRNQPSKLKSTLFLGFSFKNSHFSLSHVFLLVFLSKILSSSRISNPLFFSSSFLLKHSTYPLSHSPRTPHLHSHLSPCSHFPYSLHYIPHYWFCMFQAPDIVVGDLIPLLE